MLGARSVRQLEDLLGSLEVRLDAAHLARLEEIAPVQGGFPRSFLTGETVRRLIFGETFAALDNHRDPFA